MKTRLAGASALVALVAVAGSASAAITVFTNQALFNAAIVAPATDTFNDLSIIGSTPSPLNRVVGPYTYVASAPNNFFGAGSTSDEWLSTNTATDTITFNNFTGGVIGVGGFFFGSNIQGLFQSNAIIVTATDASGTVSQTITGTPTTSFLGFVSTTGILSMTVTAVQPAGAFAWPTVNDLTLGAIPTPGAIALLGLSGLVAARRRRA